METPHFSPLSYDFHPSECPAGSVGLPVGFPAGSEILSAGSEVLSAGSEVLPAGSEVLPAGSEVSRVSGVSGIKLLGSRPEGNDVL